MAALANCSAALGINIDSTLDNGIAASCLTSVAGNVNLDSSDNNVLKTVRFPLLTYTAGSLQVCNSNLSLGNAALKFIEVSSLSFVGGLFSLCSNYVLTSLYVSSLAFVGQSFNIQRSEAIVLLDLPALTFVGQCFIVYFSLQLTLLNLPALAFVGQYFEVTYNPILSVLSAPALLKISGTCTNVKTVMECGGTNWAVQICYTAASFSYSSAISHAAAGKACYLNHGIGCPGTVTICK